MKHRFLQNYFAAMALVALTLLSVGRSTPAEATAEGAGVSEQQAKLGTKELMDQFLTQLTALKHFFISEEKFNDPKNSTEIATYLREFSQLARQTRHDATMSQQENFKFSRHVLEEYITDTERVFRLGNKSYARWKLASTMSVCMSCHTQLPSTNRTFGEFSNLKTFSSEFDQAEFLFTTRAFDKAFLLYDKIIDGYPKNKFKPEQVETSLERQLAYFSRIKRDPALALTRMRAHEKNKELPIHLRKNIVSWIAQFEKWQKQTSPDPKTATDEQILKFAETILGEKVNEKSLESTNPYLVTYLRVSGILFEYLQSHPRSKITPDILYWLSLCDRSISNTFFYSLADLYLRECMLEYPASPVAKKCFHEYEAETILGYTGSAGTNLPAEVRKDLDQLKKFIESGGKVELRGQ